ncbi:MAG TPA: serine/threonine-protein kinase, partial [Vicinamibacteria bacterium]|nr:serine/threonine-protein kinase [Vicinamibacteria bacterium]
MDDPLAHLLDGLDVSHARRYVAERELGRGSMGVVYAGRDLLLDRPVAIKVMAASAAADADRRRYFEREARAAGRLSHRHVVTVHDFGYDVHGAPYVVMELLRGRDVRQLLAERAALPLDRRLAIVLQVLAGLAHAHACGVVHRDVKPANVFITEEGVVKLLDFGIACLGPASTAGSSDAVMGTADYMSPEQVLGEALDGRSDLFGCGALLFELLTGRPPFHAESFVTIAYRVVHEEPEYAALPPAARALVPVVRKALAKERGARYSTAADFATDLALTVGVGVAPETIHPAPAWTMPLPRLSRPAAAAPAVQPAQPWEEGAVRPPDHSPMRPRWPLRPAADDDDAAPEPGR